MRKHILTSNFLIVCVLCIFASEVLSQEVIVVLDGDGKLKAIERLPGVSGKDKAFINSFTYDVDKSLIDSLIGGAGTLPVSNNEDNYKLQRFLTEGGSIEVPSPPGAGAKIMDGLQTFVMGRDPHNYRHRLGEWINKYVLPKAGIMNWKGIGITNLSGNDLGILYQEDGRWNVVYIDGWELGKPLVEKRGKQEAGASSGYDKWGHLLGQVKAMNEQTLREGAFASALLTICITVLWAIIWRKNRKGVTHL